MSYLPFSFNANRYCIDVNFFNLDLGYSVEYQDSMYQDSFHLFYLLTSSNATLLEYENSLMLINPKNLEEVNEYRGLCNLLKRLK